MAHISVPKDDIRRLGPLFIVIVTVFITLLAVSKISLASQRNVASETNSGLFLPPVLYDSGGYGASSVAVGDVNSDGHPDLAIGFYNSYLVSILLGNGDGTFQAPATYNPGGSGSGAVSIADVNKDGKPDLLVINGSGSVGVMLGNGDGTFQSARSYVSGGAEAHSITVADVNSDGNPDLIVANQCPIDSCPGSGDSDIAVGVLLGNGDGTFQAAASYDSGGHLPLSVRTFDVNGDGRLDLLVVNNCSSNDCSSPGALGVLLGRGDGTFQRTLSYNSGGYCASSVAVADMNANGETDVVIANRSGSAPCYSGDGSVAILQGNGDGLFGVPAIHDTGGNQANSVEAADVNGDHRLDLIVANACLTSSNCETGTVGVLLGKDDGAFEQSQIYGSGGQTPWSLAVGDMNGDGRPDIVVANYSGSEGAGNNSVGVLLNNTPVCTTPPEITLSTTPGSLWPPNGKMVPVLISGTITDTDRDCTIKDAAYAVKDEYGELQPSGLVTLGPAGAYSFTVRLQASRFFADIDGRAYTVTVAASNNAGITGSQVSTVVVPHDQRHGITPRKRSN